MTDKRYTRRRVIALVIVIAVAIALMATDPVHEWLRAMLEKAKVIMTAHPVAGKVVFMVLSAFSAMAAFFSSAIIVPVAVYAWGELQTAVLLWISWIFGGLCTYFLGRGVGRRVAAWLIPKKRVDEYASKISRETSFLTVLLFQLAVPSEIPGYVLGASRYSLGRYLLVLGIAEVPFAVGAVYLGESFVRRQYWLLALIGLAGITLSVLAFRRFHREIGK